MKLCAWSVASLTLCLASVPLSAQDPEPGSVLVYPSLRNLAGRATVVSITNIDTVNGVLARFRYVNMAPTANPFLPNCASFDRFEFLTPGDTITIATFCHNPGGLVDGYLVVDAVLPGTILSVAHDFLIGSELVLTGLGGSHSVPAISFQSPQPAGTFTDLDGDGELDFDGLEYTMCPDTLYVDSFLASLGNNLALINMTGGTMHTALVRFTVWNDNEFPIVFTRNFRCWFDQPMDTVGVAFSSLFLLGTPHAPGEFDTNCDGIGDLETGWAEIDGVTASTSQQTIPNPALLGAVTSSLSFERGRPLWRTGQNKNGDFLNTLIKHPEFP